MSALKLKEFPGLQRIAPATIEKHGLEQGLRDAQYALDVQLHDLRSEFLHREGKLRQEFFGQGCRDYGAGLNLEDQLARDE